MTLQEIKTKLFPSVYKTKNGQLVELSRFAFIGTFLDEKEGGNGPEFVWDDQMNFFVPARRYGEKGSENLIELIKSPLTEEHYQKKHSYRIDS